MTSVIKAENLKVKRTFAKKMIIIAPLFMLLLAIISGQYFVQNGYNWWYTMILPGLITLITALVNQNEEKKLNYRSVLPLPVSLKKIWLGKVTVTGIYVAVANIILLGGIIAGKLFYNTASTITVTQMMMATLILIVALLWQIPWCLFLSKKFGMLIAILVNVGGGIVLGIIAADKSFWWLCPYSWITRMMCPVLGILPNGTLAPVGDAMLNVNVIPLGLGLSMVFLVIVMAITAWWFSRQEVK
ncbi:lantibiotic immunity ABC transporter MutE/EpiE family permease subunit [Acetobacterium woodii]|uniref:Antibiotic ABC transport system permease protein n=1 Tax=Acetobacterium woodii (strain ATCC 29683 / DSM 1030 / JCM 2381 / KCTC 1655 / WB1) TaxID=931626 RepID=H6LFL8_ACEWD|nr:lantibiotic immunity ABC transporter MutE/EpiE family permease subunit [Acetobacterium woodii]AFA46963.1 antibiotic ABC transport system permease protein [Acetobacterium woodii DSM 1030]